MRYQTEIFVPADRYVCLQLPDYFPEGRAVVTVSVSGFGPDEPGQVEEGDPGPLDRDHDIEWWDEFDEEGPGRAP